MSSIITVAGSIGAGKSTFIENYQKYLSDLYPSINVVKMEEIIEGNKLLELMYEDPKKWTFASQVNFLMQKVNFLEEAYGIASRDEKSVILIERDYRELLLFMKVHLCYKNITCSEYRVFEELYDRMKRILDSTHTWCVYIDTPRDICYERILYRNRNYEKLHKKEYYDLLWKVYYEEFIEKSAEDKFTVVVKDSRSRESFDRVTRICI